MQLIAQTMAPGWHRAHALPRDAALSRGATSDRDGTMIPIVGHLEVMVG